MKKIIGIIFISLMFANIGFAEMRLIEEKTIKGYHSYFTTTICVDGYKFVVMHYTEARSMVQAFEERDGKSLPTKC